MADKRERAVKRKSEFFYYSSEDSREDFDSDDSIRDKDYLESESERSSSSEDCETVSEQIMWLVPFLIQKMWLIFCNFVLLYFQVLNEFYIKKNNYACSVFLKN